MKKNMLPNITLGKYTEEKVPILLSAFEVFKRLYPYFKNVFLLESLGIEGKFNQFSYIGFDPQFIISARGKEVYINRKKYSLENPYDVLSEFSSLKSKGKDYCGGLVGYISYEGTKYFEPAFEGFNLGEFPDYCFGFYTDGFKIDKKRKTVTYFHHGQSRLSKVLGFISRIEKLKDLDIQKTSNSTTETSHQKMVREALFNIKKGNIFQVVLSTQTHYTVHGDLRRFYASLRDINPSPYMYFLKFEDRSVIGASPELLIRVKKRQIEHFGTLAGTSKRGKDQQEDKKLSDALLNNEKEVAEHRMLVDLARNDLGKICEFGSIHIKKLLSIKKFSHVQHLHSEIYGKLKENENIFSALSACFPAGTLTGAPKVEAMKIIHNLESSPRGPYGGVAGYVSFSGESMFAIVIRSLFVTGEHAYTQTGSGIVMDSNPQKEYQEILNKQRAIEEVLNRINTHKKGEAV